MKTFALLLITVVALAGQPPSVIEVQARFDHAVRAADAVEVSYVSFERDAVNGTLVPIGECHSQEEISHLIQYFRLRVAAPKMEVVDGEEVLVWETFRCGCRGEFVVTLKRSGEELLSFGFAHGAHISSRALVEDSAIRIDPESAKPFHSMLVERAQNKEAIQPPQPTGRVP